MRRRRLKTMLNGTELYDALGLWMCGKDTKEIAWVLQCEEYAAYNGLHEIRERMRKAAA